MEHKELRKRVTELHEDLCIENRCLIRKFLREIQSHEDREKIISSYKTMFDYDKNYYGKNYYLTGFVKTEDDVFVKGQIDNESTMVSIEELPIESLIEIHWVVSTIVNTLQI